MAMFDFDGTAALAVKQVEDRDGTAGHQLGRVYDDDGTARHTVFSAEEVLYDHGREIVAWEAIGSKPARATKAEDHMGAWTTSYETAGFQTAEPVDVSACTALKIAFCDEGSGYSGGYIRARAVNGNTTAAENQVLCDSNADAGVMRTLTVDISGVQGLHRVAWDVWKANAKVQVYKVWLE